MGRAVAARKPMIDRTHLLPLARPARELGISRGSVYYLPKPVSVADLAIMRRVDELQPNQVWATDITYIPMAKGLVYLAAILAAIVDWFSRKVLAWRVSITMEADFCVEAVEEALVRFGKPESFNTDQGSQFTSMAFTSLLLREKIAISRDGRGAWRDNVIVERLWHSVKYEEVYLRASGGVSEARASPGRYLGFYNARRPHSSPAAKTPDQPYSDNLQIMMAA